MFYCSCGRAFNGFIPAVAAPTVDTPTLRQRGSDIRKSACRASKWEKIYASVASPARQTDITDVFHNYDYALIPRLSDVFCLSCSRCLNGSS